MNKLKTLAALGPLAFAGFGATEAHSQATPTATAAVQFDGFIGVSGVYTGVGLGRNLSITGGGDVTIRSFHGLYPSLEVRGTYPEEKGSTAAEKNILGGLVLSRHLINLQPYGDILFGRGQINFSPPFLDPAGTLYYVQSSSNVISPGAGVNYFLSPHLGIKGDFQFQRYESPVTTSGSVYSKSFTFAVVYRINAGGLGRLRHF